MLLSTLVSRRAPQNPSVIVTACTGMLCNLAYGDLSTKRTPSSFQAGSAALGLPPQDEPKKFGIGTELTVAADNAAPTNSLRDNRDRFDIFASSGLHLSIRPTRIIRAEEQSSAELVQ